MKYAFLIFCLFLGGLTSCSPSKSKELIHELNLEFVERITEFPDSSFFSDVRKAECVNGKIYLLDVQRGDIVGLTEDFKQMEIVAPHSEIDLVMPSSFTMKQDTAYIYDSGSVNTLKVYSKGKKIRSMSSSRFRDKRMAVDDEFFYMSLPTDTSCYLQIDKYTGKNLYYRGDVINEDDSRIQLLNKKHLFMGDKNELFAVAECYPYIDRYDLETGKLKERFDVSMFPFIQENIDFIKRQPVEPKSYYTYIDDACLYKGTLFLLCSMLVDTYSRNMLVKIDVKGKTMKAVGYYELPGNFYMSICASDDYVYAMYSGRDCAIEKYKMNEK